jgi:hypothetical protein
MTNEEKYKAAIERRDVARRQAAEADAEAKVLRRAISDKHSYSFILTESQLEKVL